MAVSVNLNADMAEGHGAYDIGNDDEILRIIKSASIACGMHAGDASTMRRVISKAVTEGVSIGAHPGFNDLWGFGRRKIEMSPSDLENLIAYQIGALQGLANYFGQKVTHLKPHGALNNMAAINDEYAMAIGRAIKGVDSSIIYVALAGSRMEWAGHELGLKVAREGYCDRQYDDDGNLASRKIPGTVLKDPEVAVDQVVRMVTKGEIVSRSGKVIQRQVDTLCVHGDEPTAIALATRVRKGLEEAGVKILPLPELLN